MNNKQNKTYQTARNKAQIRRKQEGREGGTHHRHFVVQTPLPKKLKKFQKRKNRKNKIQNTQIFEIAFILVSNLRCIAFLCIEC